MSVTKTIAGYGEAPLFMAGGMMPMGPEASQMSDPAAEPPMAPEGGGGLAELQPMVEAYMGNPDPALAEEIIMSLASAMGIQMAAPPVQGGMPDEGGMPAPQAPGAMYQAGGKIKGYLKTLKLS